MASTPAVSSGLILRPDLTTPYHHPRHHLSIKNLVEVVGRNRPAFLVLRPRSRSAWPLPSRASGGAAPVPGDNSSHTRRLTVPPDIDTFDIGGLRAGDAYLGLFVRMLGLDNDPLDREQAVITLWKYSQGGKDYVDGIMKFPGCINLIVNLLKSNSDLACEAASGLLRTISSVSVYRDFVAESGAIEEIEGLLCQFSLTVEVKEQSICVLWNLSVDERQRVKIANSDLLPILVKLLDDEEIKLREAAGGVLANLALSHCNHGIMVEAGVIPKLAELLKSNSEGYKVIRKVAKDALLKLSKDEYQRILIIEEGLVLVPLIGAAAYKSLRPVFHSWPSLPDGAEIERTPCPSRYGASELLIGLNIREKNFNLDEAKMNAVVGRSQQQFLARIGAIELEQGKSSLFESSTNEKQTLLPWMDGVARLVLILGLEDVSAISKAAHAIAVASISERMRISFMEAGAVRCLVQLLGHDNEAVREAATDALEKLSVSHEVCQVIELDNVVDPLIKFLKNTNTSESLKEKSVNILARIFDPHKHMKSKFYHKVFNGSAKVLNSTISSREDAGLANVPHFSSIPEGIARSVVIDSDAISCLIEMLKASSPIMQMKAASTLEYLANFEEHVTKITTGGIESGLQVVFQQRSFYDMEDDTDYELELDAVKTEEEGLAIAAASRLLMKLLTYEKLHCTLDLKHFMNLLRCVLISNIPLHTKDWVAACLVKIQSLVGLDMETTEYPSNPIDMEVTLYQTIPRLVEQMRTSFSSESREAAVVELNGIISKGVAEYTGAVATAGGVFPLVDIITEKGGDSAVEASLAILYSLSMDDENHPAIIAAGAVPVLRRIVLSEGPQWTRALHLLRTLPT